MNSPCQLDLLATSSPTETLADWIQKSRAVLADGDATREYIEARARHSDPVTSHQAAERSVEFSGKHASAIFCWLKDHPAGGTKDEIARGTGIDAIAVARRIKELRDTAGVHDSGETRKTPTGRNATVWRVRR